MHQTLGVVIKKRDIGEADRFLTIFTRDFGKIETTARGIRKIEAKLLGHSELFCYSHFMFSDGRTRPVLTGALAIENFSSLRSNLEKLAAAFQMAEILNDSIAGPRKDLSVWNLTLSTLKELNSASASNAKKFFCFFQTNLLKHLGHQPELWKCVVCRKKIKPENNFFSPSKGGVICENCPKTGNKTIPISAEAIKILRTFLAKEAAFLRKLRLKKTEIEELELILNRFTAYHFE